MATIIDLTKTIKHYDGDPSFMKVKVKNRAHRKSTGMLKYFIKLPQKLFPKSFIGWADDTITKMGVHSTTHIDAPWHYAPKVGNERAKTIDEMPLDWGYGEGVVLDMSHKKDFELITREDVISVCEKIGVTIKEGHIVLIRTDRDNLIGTKEYAMKGTGMSGEATEWLIDQGVRVMGIDQWGWDLPLFYAAKKAKELNDSEFFWQGHLVGAKKEYYHMEQLVNLKSLPPTGFKVAVFPLKIKGASAAPARVVAIIE